MRKKAVVSIVIALSACTVFGAVQPVTFPYRPDIDPASLPVTAENDTETVDDPLTEAIVSGDIDRIIVLIESGIDINKTTHIDGLKKTYANAAWENGLDAVAEDLAIRMDEKTVKKGVIYAAAVGDFSYVEMTETLGFETAWNGMLLETSATELDEEAMRGLIERGADVNAKDRSATPA